MRAQTLLDVVYVLMFDVFFSFCALTLGYLMKTAVNKLHGFLSQTNWNDVQISWFHCFRCGKIEFIENICYFVCFRCSSEKIIILHFVTPTYLPNYSALKNRLKGKCDCACDVNPSSSHPKSKNDSITLKRVNENDLRSHREHCLNMMNVHCLRIKFGRCLTDCDEWRKQKMAK